MIIVNQNIYQCRGRMNAVAVLVAEAAVRPTSRLALRMPEQMISCINVVHGR